MGQFSWLDCRTEEQVIDELKRNVYVLIPKEFGGGYIKEERYDGYGRFGGNDIYELVVDWNAKYFENVMNNLDTWACDWVREKTVQDDFERISEGKSPLLEKRTIGIAIACYDKDNERLKYPIKITHYPDATYEECSPSKSDPNQGWYYDEDEDEDDDYEYGIYDDYEMEEI